MKKKGDKKSTTAPKKAPKKKIEDQESVDFDVVNEADQKKSKLLNGYKNKEKHV